MPRPVYIISHRTNGLDEIEDALATGANGIECDVRRHVVDHDGDFPWSTSLVHWLTTATAAIARYNRLALVYFDIKDPHAIQAIANTIRAELDGAVSCLFSTSAFADRVSFDDIADDLHAREGIAIDEDPNPDEVATWLRDGDPVRSWYSFGVPSRDEGQSLQAVMPAIQRSIALRDAGGPFTKVCVWTLSSEPVMRAYLALGVDALLVERNAVAKALEFVEQTPGCRLATREDGAFAVFRQ